LLILLLVTGFHSLHAVLLSGWQHIPISYAPQWLYLFPHRFGQLMAADCSFFCSSTAFMVSVPFCSADGCRLLILPLVNGFQNGLCAVLSSRWRQLACSLSCQRLSWFARCFALRIKAHHLFFCLSMAFTRVYVPCCLVDGSALLILPLVNGFHGLPTILLCGWQPIAHSSARQWLLRRFVCSIAWRLTANC